ncbi:MAG TPA: hypothetical protein VMN60_07525 [Longimicrobiales bacterium]|nr:hypothetical protein [Longimicrobiales bacterium]
MAELRVERTTRGGKVWLWLLLLVVVLLVAAVLLDRAGYVDVPGLGAVQPAAMQVALAAFPDALQLQEA